MTSIYGVSAPLGSGKTTAAIEFAGLRAKAGERFVIAQPTIDLIKQSTEQFRERWPNVPTREIHGGTCGNVSRAITEHTKQSMWGEVLFITHSALCQDTYWHRRADWHLIIDEAPSVFWMKEISLPVHHASLMPALEGEPYNLRYWRLVAGDDHLLERIARNQREDDFDRLYSDVARKLLSSKWEVYVLAEQFQRLKSGEVTDGKMSVFGLLDPLALTGFATTTIMSANLENTIAYRHLVERGYTFVPHKAITKGLRFNKHTNGRLLTVYYAMAGQWSKRRRDRTVSVEGADTKVGDLLVRSALDLFGDEPFAWQANKDVEKDDPFGGLGSKLPHVAHGLNRFQHLHNAVVIPALNPSPVLYNFLDEVAHIDPDEVRDGIYHEAVYQTAGRISTRNLADQTPKRIVVADEHAAERLAELYPGAKIVPLGCADLIPDSAKRGPKRKHSNDADRKRAYRSSRNSALVAQLDSLRRETNFLIDVYRNSSRPHHAIFGGSLFSNKHSRHALHHDGQITAADFLKWLRELHMRRVDKEDFLLWSPAEFGVQGPELETHRGLANVSAIWGIWLDNDGGGLAPAEFAALFPGLEMVIYNTHSSTNDATRYRVMIPTTTPLTIDVHTEIVQQIRKSLNKRGYFDRKQLEKRASSGRDGKPHGFDYSKFGAASMFYLPAQAAAGPDHSFFYATQGDKRMPIDPYQWVAKTVINHAPEPEPTSSTTERSVALARKDPKLTQFLEMMASETHHRCFPDFEHQIEQAIQRWRSHPKKTGNDEFFELAKTLARLGMSHCDLEQRLFAESHYAHGNTSLRDRRSDIPRILSWLECPV